VLGLVEFEDAGVGGDAEGEVGHTAVAGEEDDLGGASGVAEGGEAGGGAGVVEVDQDVVEDDGERLAAVAVVEDVGEAQGEEQLFTCPGGQVGGESELAAVVDDGERAGLGLDDDAEVAAGGDAGEQLGGVLQERGLVLAGVAVGDAVEHALGEVDQDVAVDLLLQLGLDDLELGAESGRAVAPELLGLVLAAALLLDGGEAALIQPGDLRGRARLAR
jgi:hypothetical protein